MINDWVSTHCSYPGVRVGSLARSSAMWKFTRMTPINKFINRVDPIRIKQAKNQNICGLLFITGPVSVPSMK